MTPTEAAKITDDYAEQKRMKGSMERYHAACNLAKEFRARAAARGEEPR